MYNIHDWSTPFNFEFNSLIKVKMYLIYVKEHDFILKDGGEKSKIEGWW